ISSSKTEYKENHPFNNVFFNGCIFELNEGKEVWYGDVDINDEKTYNAFIKTILEYKEPFLLTVETPYRFMDKLKVGKIINVEDLKFIKTKYGWIGFNNIELNKLEKSDLEKLFDNIDICVVSEDKVVKSSDHFDKILFSPEEKLTEENEYGDIDYIKSAIKILLKFI
ncbi:MAG: hypothetical protein ACP5TW_06460, partial [Thermoplasmata archaeon]